MTRLRFAVLGDPIGHSKSPKMHAAAYAARGLSHTYEAVLTREEDLAARVADLRAGAFGGLNVTVPHKRRVLALVDDVHPSANAVGAANTLLRVVSEGGAARVVAHNTDVPALVEEIQRLAPTHDFRGQEGLVIGSGGAARAAVASLALLGITQITVRARSEAKGRAMIDEMRRAGGLAEGVRVRVEGLAARDDDAFTVVVQATSAGMIGADSGREVAEAIAWRKLKDDAVALDVVYAPPETLFLSAARARGLRAEGGLGMLAAQGALAFALWLGGEPPRDAMRAALGAP